MKRRELLQQMAVAGTVLAPPAAMTGTSHPDPAGTVLPTRRLGKTGGPVTCLGLGGYHIGWPDDESVAQATIEKALEVGIRFFDTAESYGKGRSEERYGKYLIPRYRDHIFLMTKTGARDAQTAREHLEGSLRRLKTDHIDLWQLHSLDDPADADARLQAGVLEVAIKAKEEGKIRHIGFTGHASPYAHIRMTQHREVLENCATCQFPINPVDAASHHSFIEHTLPALQKNNFGILAMKTLADGRFFGRKMMNGKTTWTLNEPVVPDVLSIEECIHFALSLPVSVLITGAENPQLVEEKASMVRNFSRLSEEQRLALANKVAAFAEAGKVEYYKNDDLRT
ncbi:aldo/keto reductase [Pontiella agarivorans]|uniref:Aldo/keto reductase n=1 Tax=Pontiella agarivorans TaxID=3038953 RepID=A0ABU5MVF1_9BACT|nr:aldo/keto reductase [Pontiella agarivorans]MDZ8118140.1 aldo/keto reductase [Pontiella agarivorans]